MSWVWMCPIEQTSLFTFRAKHKADLSDLFFRNELRKYKLETKTPREKKEFVFENSQLIGKIKELLY